ncbi:uncharacterized protein LOC122631083 [Vespula pensylvanica]|uniref:Uncharacterized protein n=1 Tax=Vespula pensylvanica TaxID=30213 RepID=A0A834U8Z2_VESPE|nr:uncharacterized protein LOC122631083 [Vespula pensylvanica]KAF7422129.1 hypothetical protein H0235_009965 [Vespula pensylvanica]
MSTENTRKQRIVNILRKFKFEELEDAVLPVFPETTWNHVRSQLIKQHESFTTVKVAAVLEKIIIDSNIREKELRQRLMKLELIDISRHKRKQWFTYSVSGSNNEPLHIGTADFKQSVKEKLNKKGLRSTKVEVDAIVFNGILYLSIKYIKKDNVKVPTNYFALFLDQKYLFSAKKDSSKQFLDAITHCMGYNKHKSIDLKGKDLMSLIRLLRLRMQGALSAADIINTTTYRDAQPIIRDTGVDYTQEKHRRNFTENCFGIKPPTLDTLVVRGPNSSVSDREIASRLTNDIIQVGWEFRSENVIMFLTTLFERGILLAPLPPYISNLMSMGRNVLTLEE